MDGPNQNRRKEDLARVEIKPIDFDAHRDAEHPRIEGLIGSSPRMMALYDAIIRASKFDSYDVLIVGPTGTGKTIIARAIHAHSTRAGKKIIEVNSAMFTDELVESKLFGHRRGAFTGATENKKGLFEEASGGTLFLDEIGDMPPGLQAKVLKVIETKTVTPLGSNEAIPCDVRIICATLQNLVLRVKEGTFREDLLHRINTLRITVPTLAERAEDIPELLEFFLAREQAQLNRDEPLKIEQAAIQLLQERDWPGNVRELEKAVQRLVVAAYNEPEIRLEHVLEATSASLSMPDIGDRAGDAKLIHVPPFKIGDSIPLYVSRVILHIYNTLILQIRNHTRVSDLLKTDRNALYQLVDRHRKKLVNANQPALVLKPDADPTIHTLGEAQKRAS